MTKGTFVATRSGISRLMTIAKLLSQDISPVEDLADGVVHSDIVVSRTPSRARYLRAEGLRPGASIAAVGADSPDKQELEPSILSGHIVVTDITEHCARAGELHHALDAGLMRADEVRGTPGEIITGQKPGRAREEEIIVYEATGTALQDAAAEALYYLRALEKGVGTFLRFGS